VRVNSGTASDSPRVAGDGPAGALLIHAPPPRRAVSCSGPPASQASRGWTLTVTVALPSPSVPDLTAPPPSPWRSGARSPGEMGAEP
jgi:hypothetical protein